ncbi:hypothetical protein CMsap09_00840 [Clavibacter michiganensis]|uniref:Uncharacterized protein n=1 Tax=Clavibacter michiganensis TaxID=28447 RepID=A0A251XPG9_9MICO|nr:hypothetical protein CMsap09_00840 [Clavibacter michiganensis]
MLPAVPVPANGTASVMGRATPRSGAVQVKGSSTTGTVGSRVGVPGAGVPVVGVGAGVDSTGASTTGAGAPSSGTSVGAGVGAASSTGAGASASGVGVATGASTGASTATGAESTGTVSAWAAGAMARGRITSDAERQAPAAARRNDLPRDAAGVGRVMTSPVVPTAVRAMAVPRPCGSGDALRGPGNAAGRICSLPPTVGIPATRLGKSPAQCDACDS